MKKEYWCWECEYADCGHVWLAIPKGGELVPPRQCGKCRRTGWNENAGRGVAAGWEQKKAATQQGKAAGGDQPPLEKERPAEASIEKQFRRAAPKVIAQAIEPDYTPNSGIAIRVEKSKEELLKDYPMAAPRLPDGFRADRDGDLICDHRTGSVCEDCEKRYAKEIREWQSAKR